ncbi:hypothetical protein ACQPU1_08810 [Clostridium paraputrificum]|uniref:hypothetical protein n=1 Tax=Clostridium TaxID=1485 RepID=UPI003D331345
MSKQKIISLIGLNLGIALLNVIIFSRGILDIRIGSSTFESALGITLIIMSVGIFAIGNYKILIGKEKRIKSNDIKTSYDCINGLKQNKGKKTFTKDISILVEQVCRIEKKKEIIIEILLQKFNSSEMSFSKFNGVILEIEGLFYLNIRSVINKLNIFDEEDYEDIEEESGLANLSNDFIEEKRRIYNEYIFFVRDSIEDNEQILLKLDKLLLELSKFDSLEDGELENMSAMKEIDDLINKIKLYK